MKKSKWKTLKQGGDIYTRYLINEDAEVFDTERGEFVSQVITGEPKYKYVNLNRDDGIRTLRRVNNIMSWTFLGDPPTPSHTSDHIDQDKMNNHISNIRWADKKTQAGNRSNTVYYQNSKRTITEVVDSLPVLYTDTVRKYILRRLWVGDNLEDAKLSWANYIKPNFPILKLSQTKGIECGGVWYPSKGELLKVKGSVGEVRLRQNLEEGLPIEDALFHRKPNGKVFDYNGIIDNLKGHCDTLQVSSERVITLLRNHDLTFEQAIPYPVQRRVKHAINGEVLRNKEIFEMFNLPHLKTKSKLERCKNLRTTLEYYGVDTSEISIHLCDGDVIQWNQPI